MLLAPSSEEKGSESATRGTGLDSGLIRGTGRALSRIGVTGRH